MWSLIHAGIKAKPCWEKGLLVNSYDPFNHIRQGCFTGNEAIVWLPQYDCTNVSEVTLKDMGQVVLHTSIRRQNTVKHNTARNMYLVFVYAMWNRGCRFRGFRGHYKTSVVYHISFAIDFDRDQILKNV